MFLHVLNPMAAYIGALPSTYVGQKTPLTKNSSGSQASMWTPVGPALKTAVAADWGRRWSRRLCSQGLVGASSALVVSITQSCLRRAALCTRKLVTQGSLATCCGMSRALQMAFDTQRTTRSELTTRELVTQRSTRNGSAVRSPM